MNQGLTYERVKVTQAKPKPVPQPEPEQVKPPIELQPTQPVVERERSIEPAIETKEKKPARPILDVEFDDLSDPWGLRIAGQTIDLPDEEYNVLLALSDRKGLPVSRKLLWKSAFENQEIDEEVLEQKITNVNQLLKDQEKSEKDYIVKDTKDPSKYKLLGVNPSLSSQKKIEFSVKPAIEAVAAPAPSSEPPKKLLDLEFTGTSYVKANGQEVIFNHLEQRILDFLAKNTATQFTRKEICEAVFGSFNPELHYYIQSINSSLDRIGGVKNVISISRKGLAYIYQVSPDIDLKVETKLEQKDKTEEQELKLEEKAEDKLINFDVIEEALLSAIISSNNNQEFTLKDGRKIKLDVDESVLKSCQEVTKKFIEQFPNLFYGKQKEFAALRSSLFDKLARFVKSGGRRTEILNTQSKTTQMMLEPWHLLPAKDSQILIEHLSAIPPKKAWNIEKAYLSPKRNEDLENEDPKQPTEENEDDNFDKDETETEDKLIFVLAHAQPLEEGSMPIGQVNKASKARRIKEFTTWDDNDIAGFICKRLSKVDIKNAKLIEAIWKMIRFAQKEPYSPLSRLAYVPQLRSLSPYNLPNNPLTKFESRQTRLVYRIYDTKDQRTITLERLFRNHQLYDRFIQQG